MEQIPGDLLRPLDYVDGQPHPEGELVLQVKGIARCLGSDDGTFNFIAALRSLVQQYKSYDPPQDRIVLGMPIDTEQLATELRLPLNSDSNCIRRLVALLKAEGLVWCHMASTHNRSYEKTLFVTRKSKTSRRPRI